LFQQCPRKYFHLRVLKDVVEPESPAMLYGTQVHEAAELYIKDGINIPEKFAFIKPVLDTLIATPGKKLCEYKMGLTKDKKPCDFFAEDVWFRGVADLLILNGSTAYVVDYKTGKSAQYADKKQLELMALAVFKHFPVIERVKAGLVFLVSEEFVREQYNVDIQDERWGIWDSEVKRIEDAMENDAWNPKQNFTCKKFCLIKHCEHNGRNYR
jgi:hypothetical protein